MKYSAVQKMKEENSFNCLSYKKLQKQGRAKEKYSIARKTKQLIKTLSPSMHKHIKDLKELTLDEMKKKCCCILIPAE